MRGVHDGFHARMNSFSRRGHFTSPQLVLQGGLPTAWSLPIILIGSPRMNGSDSLFASQFYIIFHGLVILKPGDSRRYTA